MRVPFYKLDAFTRAYIECALWSTPDIREESDNPPMLDASYGADSIPDEQYELMIRDCKDFQWSQEGLLANLDDEQSGHDFWLTREGHGVGFWDRGLGEVGEKLSKACKAYGGGGDALMNAMAGVKMEREIKVGDAFVCGDRLHVVKELCHDSVTFAIGLETDANTVNITWQQFASELCYGGYKLYAFVR